jgi:hypothetical protein
MMGAYLSRVGPVTPIARSGCLSDETRETRETNLPDGRSLEETSARLASARR